MTLLKILVLAVVQGVGELLPVSSSAHVIVAARLMGLDPVSPEMTLLLVMLHTGTMLAVILFFWNSWKSSFFQSGRMLWSFVKSVAGATLLTGAVGLSLKFIIERVFLGRVVHAEIELLFGNMALIGASLFAVGVLIVYAGMKSRGSNGSSGLGTRESLWIGAVQGVCLPFRGFSRSGATISAGLVALKWLSHWLESDRWHIFGYYCLGASVMVFMLYGMGY